MAFKARGTDANFTRLQSILVQSQQQTKNHPLYQVIKGLIDACRQEQESVKSSIGSIEDTVAGATTDLSDATFITVGNEVAEFPNSRMLVAGDGVTLDTSVAGQIIVNASLFAPLTDGDLEEAELIFADGECIMVEII